MNGRTGRARKAVSLVVGAISVAALCVIASPASALPEEREWEVVSTTGAESADDVVVLPFGRPAENGEAMAFQVYGNLDTGPGILRNTYVSTRAPDKWTAKLVSPPAQPPFSTCGGFAGCPVQDNPFVAFDDNLTKAVYGSVSAWNDPIVEGEPLNQYNVYLRDIATGADTLLTNEDNVFAKRDQADIAGISSDGTVAAFEGANGPNAWADGGPTTALSTYQYAWGLKVGAGHTNRVTDDQWGGTYGGNYHSLSEDGSRLYVTSRSYGVHPEYPSGSFWVFKDPGTPGAVEQQLKVGSQGVGGFFRDASPDGHKMLFTSCFSPVAGSTADPNGISACRTDSYNTGTERVCTTDPGEDPEDPADDVTTCVDEEKPYAHNDLFLWDEDANGGAGGVTDLTTQDPVNGARVLGVLGTSDELDRVYFVAVGDLDGAGPATFGPPNVYLWDETDGITFIAKAFRDPDGTPGGSGDVNLRKEPQTDDVQLWQWPMGDIRHGARASADGSVLAFTSRAPIDPDVDYGTSTQLPKKQVYVWKIGDTAPQCVSCAGDGPLSGTGSIEPIESNGKPDEELIGQASYGDWYTRNVTDDGSKVYFTSTGALVEGAATSTQVYEYDTTDGSLEVISSGSDVEFLGATGDGSDVFFRTNSSLIPHDGDDSYDVYDARVGGGQPLPDDGSGGEDECRGSMCPQTGTGPGDPTPEPVPPSAKTPPKKKTGLRARALRKCKKRKGVAKRRCVKAALKKPL